jgi:hypothetical protein
VAGVLVHHLGPEIFFPVAGIVLVVTVLAALTQQSIRDFGSTPAPEAAPGHAHPGADQPHSKPPVLG